MSKIVYTVFYNAVISENGAHLIAVGWCNKAGCTPYLQKEEKTGDFLFLLKEPSGVSAEVITPFSITAEIPDPPRSIFVKDDYSRYQIQVNGIDAGASGENTPGKWVKSCSD